MNRSIASEKECHQRYQIFMINKVVLCRSLVDNEYYAVKSVDKKYLNSMEFGMVYFNL